MKLSNHCRETGKTDKTGSKTNHNGLIAEAEKLIE